MKDLLTTAVARPALLAAMLLALAPAALDGARASDTAPPRAEPPGLILVAERSAVGHVENAIGTLVVKRADGRVEELRGTGSLPLYEGDECRTERGGKAFIRLADGTALAINEDTSFAVRVRMETGRGMTRILRLLIGEMWLRTRGPTPLEVETPTATAAIKGTELHLRVLPDGQSVLTVVEGIVEFRNEFCSPCRTSKATQSVSAQGKRCTEPAPVDPAPVIAWIADVIR